jgi:hypothetical protein
VGIGGGAEGGGAVAEYFGFCFQLGMDLQPDHRFKFHDYRLVVMVVLKVKFTIFASNI